MILRGTRVKSGFQASVREAATGIGRPLDSRTRSAPLIIDHCEILGVVGPADDEAEEAQEGRHTCGIWLKVKLPAAYNFEEKIVRCTHSVGHTLLVHGNAVNLIGRYCRLDIQGGNLRDVENAGLATIMDAFAVPGGSPVGSSTAASMLFSLDGLVGSIPEDAAGIVNKT